MAVATVHLTDGTSTSNPADTASVAPESGSLILAAVVVANSNVGLPGAASVALSGLGLTWVQVGEQSYAQRRRVFLFRALGTPSSGAVTITYTPGANSFQEMQWAIVELAGVDTSGTDGSGAVGTPAVAETGFDTTLTVSIGDTPATGDAPYVAFGKESGSDVPVLEASYVQLSSRESANVRYLVTGWDDGQDMTATLTWGSGSGAGGIGVLVIAGEAAVTGTLVVTEADDTLAASGTVTAAGITGTVSVTEQDDTLAAAGTHAPPLVAGTLAVTEQDDTLSASDNGITAEQALPLPTMSTVVPDPATATELDLATDTDLPTAATLTDVPTLAVLTDVEG